MFIFEVTRRFAVIGYNETVYFVATSMAAVEQAASEDGAYKVLLIKQFAPVAVV